MPDVIAALGQPVAYDLEVDTLPRAVGRAIGACVLRLSARLLSDPGAAERILDLHIGGSVEDGRQGTKTQCRRGPAEMSLQDLADVHAAGNADRVQDDVYRRSVLEVGHILRRQDARDDALVAMAPRHFVALGD